MKIFNTSDFWHNKIGKQIDALNLDNKYIQTIILVETIGRKVLSKCRQLNQWPIVSKNSNIIVFSWKTVERFQFQ